MLSRIQQYNWCCISHVSLYKQMYTTLKFPNLQQNYYIKGFQTKAHNSKINKSVFFCYLVNINWQNWLCGVAQLSICLSHRSPTSVKTSVLFPRNYKLPNKYMQNCVTKLLHLSYDMYERCTCVSDENYLKS